MAKFEPGLQVMNMTNFFNREMMMYALGDFKFPKPVSFKKMLYVIIAIALWALPIVSIFGFHMNPWFLMFILVPPVFLGLQASKPVFGGKSLIDFVTTMFRFITRPRCWTDLKESNLHKPRVVDGEFEIWVSRRRELRYLAHLREERRKAR